MGRLPGFDRLQGTVRIAQSCTACGNCLLTCPSKALLRAPKRPTVVDELCTACSLCIEVCPVGAITETVQTMTEIHPIEVESYRILAERVDLSGHPPENRPIIERMIHSTADESFADSARIGSNAVKAVRAALAKKSPVVVDVTMVAAGITRYPTACFLDQVPVAPAGSTRSAAAIDRATQSHPVGAVFVIGNAPTALFRLLELHRDGQVQPAAVIGLPVGFVGAKESKAALWASPLREIAITNVGEKGGSPAAAGAFNASSTV